MSPSGLMLAGCSKGNGSGGSAGYPSTSEPQSKGLAGKTYSFVKFDDEQQNQNERLLVVWRTALLSFTETEINLSVTQDDILVEMIGTYTLVNDSSFKYSSSYHIIHTEPVQRFDVSEREDAVYANLNGVIVDGETIRIESRRAQSTGDGPIEVIGSDCATFKLEK